MKVGNVVKYETATNHRPSLDLNLSRQIARQHSMTVRKASRPQDSSSSTSMNTRHDRQHTLAIKSSKQYITSIYITWQTSVVASTAAFASSSSFMHPSFPLDAAQWSAVSPRCTCRKTTVARPQSLHKTKISQKGAPHIPPIPYPYISSKQGKQAQKQTTDNRKH